MLGVAILHVMQSVIMVGVVVLSVMALLGIADSIVQHNDTRNKSYKVSAKKNYSKIMFC
jgi:hypothetical protein